MSAINIRAVVAAVEAAEVAAIERVAASVAADAKGRAPVRKVFKESPGFKRAFGAIGEDTRQQAIKMVKAYPGYTDFGRRYSLSYLRGEVPMLLSANGPDRYVSVEKARRGSANSLKNSRTLRHLGTLRGGKFSPRVDARSTRPREPREGGYTSESLNSRLTARGRYELRSGRGVTYQPLDSGHVRVQLGGRLKRSIVADPVEVGNNEVRATVTAGVRYAKFVEFPTTHNAAQPFLLPALHDHRSRLRREVAAEINSRLGGSS